MNNRPHTWQKTVIIWDKNDEWKTNIPIDDLPGHPGLHHSIREMKAVSIPGSDKEQRTAILTFEVLRGGGLGPTTKREEILEKFRSLSEGNQRVRASTKPYGTEFKVTFNLQRSFCEEVIDFIRKVFEKFGISDPTTYHIGKFEVNTTTMHRQGEGWIPYTEQLKLRMRIQVYELSVEVMPDTAPLQ